MRRDGWWILGLSAAAALAAAGCSGPAEQREVSAGMVAREETAPSGEKRMIARSARMELFHDDPEEAVKKAVFSAKASGGWVVRSDGRSADLRVPDAKLEFVMKEIADVGDVDEKEVSGVDVTDEYFDAGLRLDNLEKIRKRYLDLLERATGVGEALPVEKELERVTLEIEILKGRQQYLKSSVTFASLHVSFRREIWPGPIGWIFYGLYYGIKWLFVWD
ncbi:MAG: DUF4349 domain-containing protein [Planctomycetes bacterium]|nr:DUF4349 domain-containing protein [Planctomycetota bacterium]